VWSVSATFDWLNSVSGGPRAPGVGWAQFRCVYSGHLVDIVLRPVVMICNPPLHALASSLAHTIETSQTFQRPLRFAEAEFKQLN
jgi:hypothetical protein